MKFHLDQVSSESGGRHLCSFVVVELMLSLCVVAYLNSVLVIDASEACDVDALVFENYEYVSRKKQTHLDLVDGSLKDGNEKDWLIK